MSIQFWLSWNNREEVLRLPINPSSFEISVNNINHIININDIGEINLIGKSGLKKITIESFFPANDYDFVQYRGYPSPNECIKLIEKWRLSQRPIRLVITQTPINDAFAIEEFKYSQKDSTGDIYFTLELKEYRFLTIPVVQSQNTVYESTEVNREVKQVDSEYIVKEGDKLWDIAKRLTGNGMNYTIIAEKNNIKNPDLIFVGQKLII